MRPRIVLGVPIVIVLRQHHGVCRVPRLHRLCADIVVVLRRHDGRVHGLVGQRAGVPFEERRVLMRAEQHDVSALEARQVGRKAVHIDQECRVPAKLLHHPVAEHGPAPTLAVHVLPLVPAVPGDEQLAGDAFLLQHPVERACDGRSRPVVSVGAVGNGEQHVNHSGLPSPPILHRQPDG